MIKYRIIFHASILCAQSKERIYYQEGNSLPGGENRGPKEETWSLYLQLSWERWPESEFSLFSNPYCGRACMELSKPARWGFPGGAVVENLPANAGDTGSSPGLGRSHMLRSN